MTAIFAKSTMLFRSIGTSGITSALKGLLAFLIIAPLLLVLNDWRRSNHGSLIKKAKLIVSTPIAMELPFNSRSGKDYSSIVRDNIFGQLKAPAPATTPTMPKTSSSTQLALIGTFRYDKSAPFAIIESKKSSEQDSFSIGDKIFNEAKLISILTNEVVIERNGARETLRVDEKTTSSVPTTPGNVVTPVSSDEFVVDEAELDRALANLPQLLSEAKAIPFFRDGKSVGLRLYAIKPGSLYSKIGLFNGDIVMSINDQGLGDLTQAIKLFERLKEERDLSVVVERAGQSKTFKYQIR